MNDEWTIWSINKTNTLLLKCFLNFVFCFSLVFVLFCFFVLFVCFVFCVFSRSPIIVCWALAMGGCAISALSSFFSSWVLLVVWFVDGCVCGCMLLRWKSKESGVFDDYSRVYWFGWFFFSSFSLLFLFFSSLLWRTPTNKQNKQNQ